MMTRDLLYEMARLEGFLQTHTEYKPSSLHVSVTKIIDTFPLLYISLNVEVAGLFQGLENMTSGSIQPRMDKPVGDSDSGGPSGP